MAKNANKLAAKELRGQADAELRSMLASKTEQLHKSKLKKSLGQLQKTHEIRMLKRDIARLSTVLSEKKAQGSAK